MFLLFAKWLQTFRIKCLSHMIIHSTSIHYWSPVCGLLISGSCQFAAVHYWSQERILWGFLSWSRGHLEVDWFCVPVTTGTREGTQGTEKGQRNLGWTIKVHWAVLNAYRKRNDEVLPYDFKLMELYFLFIFSFQCQAVESTLYGGNHKKTKATQKTIDILLS